MTTATKSPPRKKRGRKPREKPAEKPISDAQYRQAEIVKSTQALSDAVIRRHRAERELSEAKADQKAIEDRLCLLSDGTQQLPLFDGNKTPPPLSKYPPEHDKWRRTSLAEIGLLSELIDTLVRGYGITRLGELQDRLAVDASLESLMRDDADDITEYLQSFYEDVPHADPDLL